MKGQVFRKVCQLAVLLFVVGTPLLTHWRNMKVAHNSPRLVALLTDDLWGTLYGWTDHVLGVFGESKGVSDGMLGQPWGAQVFGVPLSDPLAVASLLVQGQAPGLWMALGLILPLGLALVAGKIFCSHLCPARLVFEVVNDVRLGLEKIGLFLPRVRLPRMGIWVLVAALAFTASAGAGIFHLVLPYLALSSGVAGMVLGGGLGLSGGVFLALLLVDGLVAPGQVCRSLCPTGALLELVGRRAPVALRKSGPTCSPRCNLCQRACPYGLFPGRETHRPACDSCGRCTVVCPEKRLMRTLASVLCATALIVPSSAQAHHNKGLPHYGYFENYPQVPTEDLLIVDGKWEVGGVVFNFQGLQRETSDTPNDVKLFVYAYDLEVDATLRAAVDFTIVDEDGTVVSEWGRLEPDQEGVYISRETFPESGYYELIYRFDDGGVPTELRLPMEIDLAADSALLPWVWVVLGVVVAVFVLALTGRHQAHPVHAAPADT